MANIDDIRATIIATTGRSDKQSVIEDRIQQAIIDIQRQGNHYFMEDTATIAIVVDQPEYTPTVGLMNSTFKEVSAIWSVDVDGLWDQSPIESLGLEEAREKYNADDEGETQAYTFWRGKILVWPPKPQDDTRDLLVEQYVFLPTLAFDAMASNEITATWPDLLEAWATWRFYSKLPNAQDEAKFWKPIADEEYLKLVQYSHKKHLQGKHVLKYFTSPKLRSRARALPFGGR